MDADKPQTNGEPSPGPIMEMASGFMRSRVLLTGYELGIFTLLGDGSKSSGEIAETLETAPRATDRLMNALCGIGLLEKRDGLFRNTPATARFLVKGRPGYLANLMHTNHLWETWGTLTEAVRRGTTVVGGHVEKHTDERREAFIAAMHHFAGQRAPRVVSQIDLTGVTSVLDVGGGSGAYSMAFVRAGERIRATVFDLPSVARLTRRYVEAEGLADRIDITTGDFNLDALPAGFDLVFMSMILHSNSPEQCRALVAKGAAALNPGGQLVIAEFLVDEDRAGPPLGTLFALNMLVGTEAGDTYTESEITGWMKAAGLSDFVRIDTDFDASLILGRKAE